MRQVKSITLVLENLEAVTFNREDIGTLHINNITRSIGRIAVNSINDTSIAEEFFIQLSSKSNKKGPHASTYSSSKLPFDRLLQHDDITAIGVIYQNGKEEETIYVNWGGDSDYTNINQTSVLNEKTGDLYIAISKEETADSYFKDDIQSEDYSYWRLVSEIEQVDRRE